ncbi:CRAL-TRIO lipid binding domain [Trypanosoma melophagium]|uniref:CRAL-TRIO lipid binding domain n=1 Tax=Trypanosoma melophagium TaxID=715481 RepID=UPI00351A6E43|nr:CRAL-TRIO lipid binding domain [Trypanosoma melophagium]
MADKVSVSIPEMDTLSEEQEQTVTLFLNDIFKQFGDTYPPQFMRCPNEGDRRILAYKYLKARHWSTTKAMDMVTKTMEFREKNNADSEILFRCAFPLRGFDEEDICRTLNEPFTEEERAVDLCYLAMVPYYSTGYHYWDKEGHPVLYDFSGRCDVKGLLKSASRVTPVGCQLKDTFLSYHLYMNLVQERLVRYADVKSVAKGGRRILGTTVVLDAEGLHMGMIGSQIIDIVRSIFQMDQEYFPEALHRLFVINCPAVVMYAFGLLKGSIDANTQQKVTFCSKAQSLEVLKKVIDEDKIPKILGGSCECTDGCVPGVDCRCKDMKEVCASLPLTVDVSISPGKVHVVELELQGEEEGRWEFVCTKGIGGHQTDIHFRASFRMQDIIELPEDAGKKSSVFLQKSLDGKKLSIADMYVEKELKSTKLETDNDCFTAARRGILRLVWDNQASWIHSKHVQLRVYRRCTTSGTMLSP